jgi:hypothetical protein
MVLRLREDTHQHRGLLLRNTLHSRERHGLLRRSPSRPHGEHPKIVFLKPLERSHHIHQPEIYLALLPGGVQHRDHSNNHSTILKVLGVRLQEAVVVFQRAEVVVFQQAEVVLLGDNRVDLVPNRRHKYSIA